MNAYVELLTISLKVFSEERSRQLKREYQELLETADYEKERKYPAYSSLKVKRAEKKLENFVKAFNLELEGALNALIKNSNSSSN